MPTAIIADDEPHMREMLRAQLGMLWPDLQILAEPQDGPSALLAIESLRPDVAFLDIRMPGLSGLQVARAVTVPSRIVFVTAYDTHAIEAFEASAVDYVLKPVEPARIAVVAARLQKSIQTSNALTTHQLLDALARLGLTVPEAGPDAVSERLEWLQVAVGQQVHMVHIDDVRYFESDAKYTRVVADGAEGLIRMSLKELLGQLDERQFLQTHRSVLVNRKFVRAVHRQGDSMEIELRDRSERLKVSLGNHHLFRAM
ncbi:LytR/AlgR family response regulator transcription factor [Ralstonia insidiosa]|uniref:Response regulator transcription factor n=1 Tax=Ralstonia insidiosa TaxID=190721 RepID=A0A848P8L9_9RALS|nr:LytTR family DNA-binding domain-containing protein [Ralstonia insidiosa]NMV41959.1 response regulator transcription factor [Ralstonia insidiosa]